MLSPDSIVISKRMVNAESNAEFDQIDGLILVADSDFSIQYRFQKNTSVGAREDGTE